MKTFFKVIIFIFLWIPGVLKAQSDNIAGYWRTLKGNAQLEVFRESDGRYGAKVVWLRIEKDRPDINNENESLRHRKILGLQVMTGLKYDSRQHRWEDGKIYDPESGKTYSCVVNLEHSNEILLLKGYIPGLKVLSKEKRWVRESKLRQ